METGKTRKAKLILTSCMTLLLLCNIAVVVLYETDILPSGERVGESTTTEFVVTTIMELITIAVIPLSLKLFKLRNVRNDIVRRQEQALTRWGLLRMLLLMVTMMANTLLYYGYMNTTFGYMAIILLLCLPFIVPTQSRCEAELNDGKTTAANDKNNEEEEVRQP